LIGPTTTRRLPFLPWKKARSGRLGAVGFQDQIAELLFLAGERLFLLFAGEPPGDVEIGLALVAAEVEHLEGAEGFAAGFQLALHLDEPLARGVDAELAEVGGDPFAPELFGHGGGRAAAAEKVRHQIAFVAAGFEDTFKQAHGLLRLVTLACLHRRELIGDVDPQVLAILAFGLVEITL
jgi:hypothetical protein